MAHQIVADEQFVFRPETRNKFFILLAAGVVVFILGLFLAMKSGEHEGAEGHHGSLKVAKELVASTEHGATAEVHEHAKASGEHHGTPTWLKRLHTSLWMNNVYFIGLGLIGLFFV